MNKIRKYIFGTALMSCVLTASAQKEVIYIKYNDGLTDYIPVEEVKKISFIDGVDQNIAGFNQTCNVFDRMKAYNVVFYNAPFDFGYPALMVGLNAQTEDCFTDYSGYNWFTDWHSHYKASNARSSLMMWFTMYHIIAGASDVLNATASDDEASLLLRAQAYALRSFGYWNLIQTFAPNSPETLNQPALPIIGDDTYDATSGAKEYPLSTRAEVYDYMLSDINAAINILTNIKILPAVIDVEQSKRYIGLDVAYGLRARYYLTMHRYDEAARDAQTAIDNSSARPLLREAAAFPGFCNAKASNWMWGITVLPTDGVTTSGIVNFQSQMCSYNTAGYVSVGAARYASQKLANYLAKHPDDVRNYWFVSSNSGMALLSRSELNDFRSCCVNILNNHCPVNVKFGMRNLGDRLSSADVPLMRIEEIYLIMAEGLAMSGNVTEGQKILNDFVSEYRNPRYNFATTSAEELRDEILWQRRLELWGEGLVAFDYLRLQRDLNYLDEEHCSDSWKFGIRGNSHWMLYAYPPNGVRIAGFDYDAQPAGYPELNVWND